MKKVFIIHGWTYTLSAWEECIKELRARTIEPVMLKVPGLTEESSAVWDIEKYIAWLHEKLTGEKDIILIGHSNGGRIAIAYAAKYPQALSKLMLIDAAGIVHNELPIRMKRAIFGTITHWGKKVVNAPLLRKVFYKLIRANDYERAPHNMRETMHNLITVDLTPKFSEIKVPTYILWGEQDKETPISDAYLMKEKILNSQLFIIENTGHSPHKTHPAQVAGVIAEWIS
jgi:pimeloyl-ACP methyl ester carboxylesterase